MGVSMKETGKMVNITDGEYTNTQTVMNMKENGQKVMKMEREL